MENISKNAGSRESAAGRKNTGGGIEGRKYMI